VFGFFDQFGSGFDEKEWVAFCFEENVLWLIEFGPENN